MTFLQAVLMVPDPSLGFFDKAPGVRDAALGFPHHGDELPLLRR